MTIRGSRGMIGRKTFSFNITKMVLGMSLDGGSGVTCISKNVAARLDAHVTRVHVTFQFWGEIGVRVADGRKLTLSRRTGRVQATVMTLWWAPVVIDLALEALQGSGDVLITGSKTMMELLGIDVMPTLRIGDLNLLSEDAGVLPAE